MGPWHGHAAHATHRMYHKSSYNWAIAKRYPHTHTRTDIFMSIMEFEIKFLHKMHATTVRASRKNKCILRKCSQSSRVWYGHFFAAFFSCAIALAAHRSIIQFVYCFEWFWTQTQKRGGRNRCRWALEKVPFFYLVEHQTSRKATCGTADNVIRTTRDTGQ